MVYKYVFYVTIIRRLYLNMRGVEVKPGIKMNASVAELHEIGG